MFIYIYLISPPRTSTGSATQRDIKGFQHYAKPPPKRRDGGNNKYNEGYDLKKS